MTLRQAKALARRWHDPVKYDSEPPGAEPDEDEAWDALHVLLGADAFDEARILASVLCGKGSLGGSGWSDTYEEHLSKTLMPLIDELEKPAGVRRVPPRECAWCGQTFTPSRYHPDAKYCRDAHRTAAYKARQRRKVSA